MAATTLVVGTCSRPPGTLEQIAAAGELRVATRNSPNAFYLGVDGPEGPEYELARGFARELGVPLRIIQVTSASEAVAAVREGRAHVAAAGLIVTSGRAQDVAFGPAYQTVRQQVFVRKDGRQPRSPGDLVGLEGLAVPNSAHAEALKRLQTQLPTLTWQEPADHDTLDLFGMVATGMADYVVATSVEFAIGRHLHPNLRAAFDLQQAESIAWAVSRRDDAFRQRVADYFAAIAADGRLAAILQRQEDRAARFDYVDSANFVAHLQARLPPLQPLFEQAAQQTGEDWRLLAAIGYQESKWQALATSPTGVRGIMMLTEDTARRVGVSDRLDPAQSIHGGARYLSEVRRKIPERIPEPDRTWFALAAYNQGFGHIEDARILTQRRGKNPDSWNDVRETLPLLSEEAWYSQTRRGYARGWEAVGFVRNVRDYLDRLEWMTGAPENGIRLQAEAQEAKVADSR